MLALGLNSGSSFDGIDAVLVDVDLGEDGLLKRPRCIAGKSVHWPKRVADRVLAAFENKLSIFELCRLNYVAGVLYEAIAKILAQCEVFGHQRYLMQMAVGAQPQAATLRSIELLGAVVAPAVRAALRELPLMRTAPKASDDEPEPSGSFKKAQISF